MYVNSKCVSLEILITQLRISKLWWHLVLNFMYSRYFNCSLIYYENKSMITWSAKKERVDFEADLEVWMNISVKLIRVCEQIAFMWCHWIIEIISNYVFLWSNFCCCCYHWFKEFQKNTIGKYLKWKRVFNHSAI